MKNNYFTECAAAPRRARVKRLIDFVYLSTLGLRVIKKKTPRGVLDTPRASVEHTRARFFTALFANNGGWRGNTDISRPLWTP